MTDRRRNSSSCCSSPALLVGSRRRDRHEADAARPRPAGRRRARLPGPSRRRSSPRSRREALDRAIDIMRERVDPLGVSEPEIQRSGRDQISSGCPTSRTPSAAERAGRQVAQLFFYDWEPNVIGAGRQARTRPNPRSPAAAAAAARRESAARGTSARPARPRQRSASRRPQNNTHERPATTSSTRATRRCSPAARRRSAEDERRATLERAAEPSDERDRSAAELQALGSRGSPASRSRSQGTSSSEAEQPDDIPRPTRATQLVRPRTTTRAARHGHQEPRAELRPGAGSAPADRHVRLHRRGRERVRRTSRARSPSAAQ